MEERILELKNISKSFYGVKALQNVNFNCRKGEVHCLAGENGAGKSTLLKILSGLYQPDDGEIQLFDELTVFKSPHDAQKKGIAMVYQELTLIPELTVVDNVFLNVEVVGKLGKLNRREMYKRLDEIMAVYEISLNPDTPVRNLSIAQQQMTEILKILIRKPEIIILDEPTSALSETEVSKLFSIVRRMTAADKTVIFISHRMKEVFEIADRITVLKDGVLVGTKDIKELTENDLVKMMVGRSLNSVFPPVPETISDEVVFEVKDFSIPGCVKNVNFQVHKGEIVGIAGLEGHGQTELLNGIAGLLPQAEGEVIINKERIKVKTPWKAIAKGISLVPQDRKTEGLFLSMSVKKNLTIVNQKRAVKFFFLNRKTEDDFSTDMIKRLSIKTNSLNEEVQNLSGGNQQKVVLGKELAIQPKLLLFNDPTRGIDIEAKSQFYSIMRDLSNQGVAVVLSSTDLMELIGISDKIIVMYEGGVSGVLEGHDVSEEIIMHYALGLDSEGENDGK